MKSHYEFHEAANIFPMDDENLDSLAEDIKANGLQCPIELLDDYIVDGRRRYMACRMAGVKPDFVTVKPDDPIAYVVSLNLHRRHLTVSQRSMVMARVRKMYEDEAKGRQAEQAKRNQPQSQKVANLPPIEKKKSRDAAGEAIGVSGRSVDYASKVLRDGTPELIKAVDTDKIAVSTGAKIALHSPDTQRELVAKAKGRPSTRHTEKQTKKGAKEGKGIILANEAINSLKKIPKSDPDRERAFQIVQDWLKRNK